MRPMVVVIAAGRKAFGRGIAAGMDRDSEPYLARPELNRGCLNRANYLFGG